MNGVVSKVVGFFGGINLSESTRKEKIVTTIVIALSTAIIALRYLKRSQIRRLESCRTPSSMTYFLMSKCSADKSVRNVISGVTKDPEVFITEVKSDYKRASFSYGLFGRELDNDVQDRLVVVYNYITQYTELKKAILKLKNSTNYKEYTELLRTSLMPKGASDWTVVGFQREDTPETDYRGAGALAPVMLYALTKLDKKFINNVVEESKRDDNMYMFASVNIGIIFKQSELLESDFPRLMAYVFGEYESGLDTDINPFDPIKELGKNLIVRRYALLYQNLAKRFDKFFHDSNGTLIQSQQLLDRFFELYKKGEL